MPATTERSSDRFSNTILSKKRKQGFTTSFAVPICAPFCSKVEIIEMGVSVGAITGGTAPGCALQIFSCDSSTASLVNEGKGTSVYSLINGLVCDAEKTLLKQFIPGELIIQPVTGANLYQNFSPNVLPNPNYGVAATMRVIVSGTPTNIADALAWVRFRPYWEE